MAVEPTSLPVGGFKFDNVIRNAFLVSKGYKVPKATKTGTTIVAACFEGGVIMGSDTRASSGNLICDKYILKIHYLQPNIYCCGAGTAADTTFVTDMVSASLELHRLATDRLVPVRVAITMLKQHLYRYQGHVGAALIVGGVDNTGPYVCSIAPHGSSHQAQYTTMGSGSLAAMSVFERFWKPGMTMEACQKLVADAIRSGIYNDMGSGNNISLCVITKTGAKMLAPYEIVGEKGPVIENYAYRRGASAVLSTQMIPIEVIEEKVKVHEEAMEVTG